MGWVGETGRRLSNIAERALICRWAGTNSWYDDRSHYDSPFADERYKIVEWIDIGGRWENIQGLDFYAGYSVKQDLG